VSDAAPGVATGEAGEPGGSAVRLPAGVLVRTLLRSFTVQGSWNYRTLIGTGFAYALLPVLRHLEEGRPAGVDAGVRRHAGLFNSHPYLTGIALGGVARLEAERQPPELIARFKTALRGSLGTIGDRLVWAGWRPVSTMLALALFLAGAPWWVAAGAFLLAYNAGHLALRIWGLRLGVRYGLRVGERLRASHVGSVQQLLPPLGAFLLGVLVPLAASGRFVGMRPALPWIAAAIIGAAIGLRFGAAIRGPLAIMLGGAALLGVLLRNSG
jgi:mannose/fructose/N-acetylgalactosamine-specific phosphotransferase system component IID